MKLQAHRDSEQNVTNALSTLHKQNENLLMLAATAQDLYAERGGMTKI